MVDLSIAQVPAYRGQELVGEIEELCHDGGFGEDIYWTYV